MTKLLVLGSWCSSHIILATVACMGIIFGVEYLIKKLRSE